MQFRLVDWLIGGQVDWLIGWLVGWLVGRLVGRLIAVLRGKVGWWRGVWSCVVPTTKGRGSTRQVVDVKSRLNPQTAALQRIHRRQFVNRRIQQCGNINYVHSFETDSRSKLRTCGHGQTFVNLFPINKCICTSRCHIHSTYMHTYIHTYIHTYTHTYTWETERRTYISAKKNITHLT